MVTVPITLPILLMLAQPKKDENNEPVLRKNGYLIHGFFQTKDEALMMARIKASNNKKEYCVIGLIFDSKEMPEAILRYVSLVSVPKLEEPQLLFIILECGSELGLDSWEYKYISRVTPQVVLIVKDNIHADLQIKPRPVEPMYH